MLFYQRLYSLKASLLSYLLSTVLQSVVDIVVRGVVSVVVLLLLCFVSESHAQVSVPHASCVVLGIVREERSLKPLGGVVIAFRHHQSQHHASVKDSSTALATHGVISAPDGTFTVRLWSNTYTLSARTLAYKEATQTVNVLCSPFDAVPDTVFVEVRLKPLITYVEAITVEGRSPSASLLPTQPATVIAGSELEQMRGQTVGEALKHVAGVTLLQTGPSIAKPVIRGLHSQRVVVVNAGVQQEGQQWGAEHAPEIDPFAPARLEVVRGAASVEYGVGAIGGVVRVLPRELPTIRTENRESVLGGEITFNAFSNNAQGAISGFLENVGFAASTDTARTLLDNLAWRVQASARRAGDARTPEYVIGNSGFAELSGAVHLGYAGKANERGERCAVELYVSYFSTELGIFRGSHIGNTNDLLRAIENGRPLVESTFSYEIRPPKQQISHELITLKGFHDLEGVGRVEAQYGWQQNDRAEFDAHNFRVRDSAGLLTVLNRPSLSLELTTHSLETKFKHLPIKVSTPVGSATLTGTAGLAGMRQNNVRAGRVFLIPDYRSWSGGVFAVETLSWHDVVLNAGVRWDYRWTHVFALERRDVPDTTQVFANVSGALGILWSFGEHHDEYYAKQQSRPWSLAIHCSTAWRPPLVNEQFSNDVHHGTAQFEIGNRYLTPERSYGADVTLRHEGPALNAEMSAYLTSIDGFMFLLPDVHNPTITVRGTFPTFRYEQATALLRGVDGSLRWMPHEAWLLGATFSLLRGDNHDSREPLFLMPSDRARLFVRADVKKLWNGLSGGLFGGVGSSDALNSAECSLELSSTLVRQQDRFPQNVDYALPPAGYALLDATLFGTVIFDAAHSTATMLRWSLSIHNVLNTSYRDYLSRFRYFTDEPGRNIVLRVSVPFGAVANSVP